jgi:hypothetical protein
MISGTCALTFIRRHNMSDKPTTKLQLSGNLHTIPLDEHGAAQVERSFLVVTKARYTITVDSATGEPLDNETVAARQRTKDWSTMKGGPTQDGLAVCKNADDALFFIRPDGIRETGNIWSYNLWHFEGCCWFEF